MITLMLVLIGGTAPQNTEAVLQSCEVEAGRWICRYQVPATDVIRGVETLDQGAAPSTRLVPVPLESDSLTESESALVRRCAEASWFSLCLPADRRTARALRATADARDNLRRTVTRLLSEDRCADAIRTALEGGDLTLARQAREFCAPPYGQVTGDEMSR